jgi:hypothetical protein
MPSSKKRSRGVFQKILWRIDFLTLLLRKTPSPLRFAYPRDALPEAAHCTIRSTTHSLHTIRCARELLIGGAKVELTFCGGDPTFFLVVRINQKHFFIIFDSAFLLALPLPAIEDSVPVHTRLRLRRRTGPFVICLFFGTFFSGREGKVRTCNTNKAARRRGGSAEENSTRGRGAGGEKRRGVSLLLRFVRTPREACNFLVFLFRQSLLLRNNEEWSAPA